MKITRRFARRFRLLGLLRGVLLVGAAFHLGTAAALLSLPGRFGEVLGLSLPEGRVVLWLLAGLLAALSGLYVLAARDPRRYAGVIAVLVAGRLLGAVALGGGALARPDMAQLWLLAAVDLAFAAAIAGSWLPLRV